MQNETCTEKDCFIEIINELIEEIDVKEDISIRDINLEFSNRFILRWN